MSPLEKSKAREGRWEPQPVSPAPGSLRQAEGDANSLARRG